MICNIGVTDESNLSQGARENRLKKRRGRFRTHAESASSFPFVDVNFFYFKLIYIQFAKRR